MKKRLLDCDCWKDPWFRKLPPKYKLFWFYVLTNCECWAEWKPDFELATYLIGDEISEKEALSVINAAKERVEILSNGNWFITGFNFFQYGDELSDKCNAHKPVLENLKRIGKEGYQEGYLKGTGRDQNKDQYNNQNKDKDKENTAYQEFEKMTVSEWNTFCERYPQLSRVKSVTKERRKHLKERFTEAMFREFNEILDAVSEQPFLINGNPGSETHKNWKVDFDWLIHNGTNYVKVLERKYKDGQNGWGGALAGYKR